MAHYYIGDVQGCYDPLQRLLEEIKFDTAKDRLVFCGDIVNRGGHSLEVLRLLYSIRERVTVTLGNHDFNLLRDDARYPNKMTRNGEFRQILAAEDRQELMDWLAHQPMVRFDGKRNLLAIHAGVMPLWTLEDTLKYATEVENVLRSPKRAKFLNRLYKTRRRTWRDDLSKMNRRTLITQVMTRMRYCNHAGKLIFSATGPPGTQPEGYLPWFKHKHRATRDVKIIFGHWAALGVRLRKRYVALDSGCVWGGKLSAWRAQDEELFQVPYFAPKPVIEKKKKKAESKDKKIGKPIKAEVPPKPKKAGKATKKKKPNVLKPRGKKGKSSRKKATSKSKEKKLKGKKSSPKKSSPKKSSPKKS